VPQISYFWVLIKTNSILIIQKMTQFLLNKISIVVAFVLLLSLDIGATQLNGNYTINSTLTASTTNFRDFSSAITYMTSTGARSDGGPANSGTVGVAGPVRFNVAAGTFTVTAAISVPVVTGASPVNTITFDGGNGNAATRIITGNIATSAVFIFNLCKYVNIRNLSITNTYTSNCGGVVVMGNATADAGSKNSIKNCIISLPNVSSTTSSCIAVSASSTGYTISANRVDSTEIDSNITNGAYYGIISSGATSALYNRGVKIRNNTLNNPYYYGIYLSTTYNGTDILNNDIIGSLANPGGAQYGIYMTTSQNNAGAVSHQIIGNKIKNIKYAMYLLLPNGATTCPTKIYNNMISNFGGTTNYGIYVSMTAGYYLQVYHNTVNINNTANSTKYGFYTTGSVNLLVKNNIFAITAGAGTVYPAYFATNPTGNVVNYNNYYNSSSTSVLYRGSALTTSNYKTITGGGDSSFNEMPGFVSQLDLHLTDGCGGKGVNLTSIIPTDIDGNTRSVTPDIGAYEFTGQVNNNLAIKALLQPVAPITTGLNDLRILVKNVGLNPVYSFNVAYKNNLGSPVIQNWFGTLLPCDTTSVLFTSSNQINLIAVNSITAYTYSPNTVADADPSNDTLKVSLYEPLVGNYTIGGTNPNFTTFNEAVNALNIGGISGSVYFTVAPGTYTEQVDISQNIIGLSAVNTITFDGVDASNRILTNSNVSLGNHTLRVGKNYITVRNLTIRAASATAGWPLFILNTAGTTTAMRGVKIKNCVIEITNPAGQGVSSTSFMGIAMGNAYNSLGQIYLDSAEIDSNIINYGYYGIYMYGYSGYTKNIWIRGNQINYSYQYGIYGYYTQGLTISGNRIDMHTANQTNYGIYTYYCQNSSALYRTEITANKIVNAGYYGIYLGEPLNSALNRGLIANNMIGGGFRYPYAIGIELYSYSTNNSNIDFYNNSINLDVVSTSSTSAALRMNSYYYYTLTLANKVKNNHLIVSKPGSLALPFYIFQGPMVNYMNYNNCYRPDTTGNFVYYAGTYYTKQNYKGIGGYNLNSIYANPQFVSDTLLNSLNGCLKGDTISIITTDIYGNPRNSPPNMGAYEYPGSTNDMTVLAVTAPAFPISSGTQDLVAKVANFGGNMIYSFNIAYKLNNGSPVSQVWFGALNPCDTTSVIFTGSNQINIPSGTSNTVKVYTSLPNALADGNPSNDTLVTTLSTPMIGTYTIGGLNPDFTTFNLARAALELRGVSGDVIFNVRTGTYNEQVAFGSISGASQTSTITFKSQANHPDSVKLQRTSIGSGDNYMIKLANASYFKFDQMSFLPLSASFNRVFEITGNSSFDTVSNCNLTAPITTASSTNTCHVYAYQITGGNHCFINNKFTGASYGVYLYGVSTVSLTDNNAFIGNTFTNLYYSDLFLYYTSNTKVKNNIITTNSVLATQYGIYAYYGDSALEITGNKISGIAGGYGIRTTYCDGFAGKFGLVANNVISMGTGTNTCYGIYEQYSNSISYVHNTVNIASTSTGTSYAGYFYYNSAAYNYPIIKNNVFANSGTGYAVYYYNPLFQRSDYNSLSTNGALLVSRGTPANTYANLQLWKAAGQADSSSIQYRPGFISQTNLDPNLTDTAVWSLKGRGVHVPFTLTDFNGNPRPATRADGVPSIGAFEFTPTALPPLATFVPAVPAAGTTQAILLFNDTIAKIAWDAFSLVPSSISARLYTGTVPPMMGSATAYMYTYWDINASPGYYQYDLTLYYNDAWLGTNPNEIDIKVAQKSVSSPWIVYLGTLTTNDTIKNTMKASWLTTFSYFTGTDNFNPLPVKLADFIARKEGSNVDLAWTTASEKNLKLFGVERSTDAIDFEPVGKVEAKGNSNVLNTYSTKDLNALNRIKDGDKLYYRLKMTDRDETFEYSKTVAVEADGGVLNADIEIYPNPFVSSIGLTLKADTKKALTIELMDLQGRLVIAQNWNCIVGQNETQIAVPTKLASGTYLLTLREGGKKQVVKVIKQ